jgi:tape measure domain-containing protein
MADQTYVIEFREDGAARVKRNINAMGKAGKTATKSTTDLKNSINLLTRALRGMLAYIGTREIIQAADAWTQLSNKIKVVVDTEEQLISTRSRLEVISRQTRSSIEANTSLYQRLSIASKNLGKSQEDILDFTEAVAKTFAIQGAEASEVRSAMLQLAQGLGSTAVRGDELRSVMENNMVLMKAIGDATGLTISEIKDLTAQGKFLSKDFFEAVMTQVPQINSDFAKMSSTMSQAGQVLRDRFIAFIGRFSDVTGAANAVAQAVLLVADNIGLLAAAGGAFVALKFVKYLRSVEISFSALNATLAKTIIAMAKLVALSAAFFLAYEAGRTFFENTRQGALLMQKLANSFELLQFRMENFRLGMSGDELENYEFRLALLKNTLAEAVQDIENTDFAEGQGFDAFIKNVTNDFNELTELFKGFNTGFDELGRRIDIVGDKSKTFFGAFKESFLEMNKSVMNFAEIMATSMTDAIRGFSDEFASMVVDGKADFKDMARSIVKDMISMMTQAIITRAVMSAFGGAGGGAGIGAALAGGGGRQFGGPVQKGQPVMVGERRREIFVPQSAGRIEPYPEQGGQSQPVSIVNVMDEQMYYDAMASTTGEKVIMNVVSRNRKSLGLA